MNKSNLTLRIQSALFLQEKGMLVFYLICIVIMGVITALIKGVESCLATASFLTIVFLKPLLSDSIAGERDKYTLEPLLSSSISTKDIIWGKLKFSILFSITFFMLSILCSIITCFIMHIEVTLSLWQWIGAVIFVFLNFTTISIVGIYKSAISPNLHTADSQIAKAAYPLSLLTLVQLSVILSAQLYVAAITGGILFTIYLYIFIKTLFKLFKMKQPDYYENIHNSNKQHKNTHESKISYYTPKSYFQAVLIHEFKYLLTLKTILLNFAFLCISPAIIVCLMKYFTNQLDLYYAVLITVIIISRIPTNLIAYSIGGEKVYKTGESLLSTPVSRTSMFLAKCTIPLMVSTIMLILSSTFTLVAANLVCFYDNTGEFIKYNTSQLVILFPLCIIFTITMSFASAVLSLVLKTPRHGLYISSIMGIILAAPVIAIVYLDYNVLQYLIAYSGVLVICNTISTFNIKRNISKLLCLVGV